MKNLTIIWNSEFSTTSCVLSGTASLAILSLDFYLKSFYLMSFIFLIQMCWACISPLHFSDISIEHLIVLTVSFQKCWQISIVEHIQCPIHSLSCDTYPRLPHHHLVCFLLETSCINRLPKELPSGTFNIVSTMPHMDWFASSINGTKETEPTKNLPLKVFLFFFNFLKEESFTNRNNQKCCSFEMIPLHANRTSCSPINLWEQYKYSGECVSSDWYPINHSTLH